MPVAYAEQFIPIGIACRPAYWLKKSNLRLKSYPFDWLMGVSLELIVQSLKFDCDDWFKDYEVDQSWKSSHLYVKDINNKFVAMHHFSFEYSVEEFLPEFLSVMRRRLERLKIVLSSSNSVCFFLQSL